MKRIQLLGALFVMAAVAPPAFPASAPAVPGSAAPKSSAPASAASKTSAAPNSPAKPASTRPATPTAKASDPLPPFDEIQQAFDAGDHPKTLELVRRVLARGKASPDVKAYDRYDLLALKGEAHLQLKQLASAGDAFGAAAKETEDPVRAATARATQQVLRAAKAFAVETRVPRTGEKAMKVDVLDRERRGEAFRILYDDLRAAAEPKVKSALRARELTEIDAVMKFIAPMRDLELAITGDDDEQVATRRQLGERATDLMRKELNKLHDDVAELREAADTIVAERVRRTGGGMGVGSGSGTNGGVGFGVSGSGGTLSNGGSYEIVEVRRGLTEKDRAELQSIIKTCKRIVPAATNLTTMLGNGNDAKDLQHDAATVGKAADRLLQNYPNGRSHITRDVTTYGR